MPPQGAIVWFTGLSGAGKTTLCREVAAALNARNIPTTSLDGDELRKTLCAGLGFSREDREENVRRVAALANTHAANGELVLVALISPYRSMRQAVRDHSPNFIEVYVNAPLATCINRDPKGLYKRALAQEIQSFTGISDPYEPPLTPEVEVNTELDSAQSSAAKIITALDALLKLQPTPPETAP